jgi:hypothetical protein
MALIFVRESRPNAHVWRGRRLLALLDAVAWPILWIFAVRQAPLETGVVGNVIVAAAVLVAGLRSVTALSQNQRYRFTTWRWGRIALVLIAVGLLLKMAVGLS